jgi:hypothetical protein
MASNGDDQGAYPTIGDPSKKRKQPLPVTTRFMCPPDYDPKAWQARVDLAACYHLCNKMDLNEVGGAVQLLNPAVTHSTPISASTAPARTIA